MDNSNINQDINVPEFNKLENMFTIQRSHDSKFSDIDKFNTDPVYKLEFIQRRILDIADQTIKLLNEFDWKAHALDRNENLANAKEQLIDIQKYIIGFGIMLGMNSTDWYKSFVNKSMILEQRWKQNSIDLHKSNKVVIFDIDNVLIDFDTEYKKYLCYQLSLDSIPEKQGSYNYADTFGISKAAEENHQRNFVYDGGYLRLLKYDYADDVIKYCRDKGYIIALSTARPSWIHKRLAHDTIASLKANNIDFDMIFFNKDKADTIVNNIYPANVIAMVEDRDKHAIEVANIGVNVILIDKPYNKDIKHLKIFRSDGNVFESIKSYLEVFDE